MNAETEQLLGTLEVICMGGHNYRMSWPIVWPMVWDTSLQGKYAFWNLLISQNFVRQTDPELAFKHWQDMERWGAPTDLTIYNCAPLRTERESPDWNEAIAAHRQAIYGRLQLLLNSHFVSQETYELSAARSLQDRRHPKFSVFLIIGELSDGRWVCLLPTVPDQLGITQKQPTKLDTSALEISISNDSQEIAEGSFVEELAALLKALKPLEMYGYYHGGYDYSYVHRLVGAIAPSKLLAIENALQAAKMLVKQKMSVEYVEAANSRSNSRKMSQFMNQVLEDRTLYIVSFWDIAHSYELGRMPQNDWIGVHSISEFEYNP